MLDNTHYTQTTFVLIRHCVMNTTHISCKLETTERIYHRLILQLENGFAKRKMNNKRRCTKGIDIFTESLYLAK